MVRAVVDTNILLSVFLTRHANAIPRQIWLSFLAKRFVLVISPMILNEFMEALKRPKIVRLLKDDSHKDAISFLESFAEIPKDTLPSVSISRDPKDDHILALAIQAKVDFIVTGDKDLTTLKTFHSIPILTPRKFLTELHGT